MTDKIKGKIKNIETKTGTKNGKEWTLEIIELEDGTKHSTFDQLPEGWAIGKEIEFDRIMKGDFSNIAFQKPKSEATAEAVEAKIVPKFEDLIKVLTMPKVSVGFEKTIQEKDFEPRKRSVYITMNSEEIDPKKISAMLKIAETEVMAKFEEDAKAKEDKEKKLNEELDKRIESASKPENSAIEKVMQKAEEQKQKDAKSFM